MIRIILFGVQSIEDKDLISIRRIGKPIVLYGLWDRHLKSLSCWKTTLKTVLTYTGMIRPSFLHHFFWPGFKKMLYVFLKTSPNISIAKPRSKKNTGYFDLLNG